MSRTKRVLAGLLAIVMIAGLAACGGGGTGGGPSGTGPGGGDNTTLAQQGYAFRPEFFDMMLPGTGLDIFHIEGDTLFVRYRPLGAAPWTGILAQSREEAMDPIEGIATVNIDGTGFQTIWQSVGGDWEEDEVSHFYYENINAPRVTNQGNILFVRNVTHGTNWPDWEFHNDFSILEVDRNGNLLREISLIEDIGIDENDLWGVSALQTLSDGRILLALSNQILLLEADFSRPQSFPVQEISTLIVTQNDEVLVSIWGTQDLETRFFDLETGSILTEDDSLFSTMGSVTAGVGEYDVFLSTHQGVTGVNLASGQSTQLFTWLDLDMTGGGRVVPNAEGDLFFFEEDWSAQREGVSELPITLVRLRKVDAASLPQQTILTLGTLELSWEMQQEVVEFNRRNPQYRIQVRTYWDWMSGESREDAVRRFNTDLITGNIPDIIDFSMLTYTQYARRGFLADLGAMIDADPQLSRADFVYPVFELLEIGGTLYTVASSFNIQTVVGHPAIVGTEMGWTIDQFMQAANNLAPGATVFGEQQAREDFIRSLLGTNLSAFIDTDTGNANFETDEFRAYLEFARSLPTQDELWGDIGIEGPGGWVRPMPMPVGAISYVEIAPLEGEEYDDEDEENRVAIDDGGGNIAIRPPIGDWRPDDWVSPFATGETLLMMANLWTFSDIFHMQDMFGGGVTFIGYPTQEGTGSVIAPRSLLAISANSQHQDAAWSFVRTMLTPQYQRENIWSFATNRTVLEEQIYSAMNPEDPWAHMDEIPEWAWTPQSATQADIDQIMALIENTRQIALWDDTVIEMIEVELLPFFAGDRSLDETVRIIQNRVQMYLSERG